MTIKLRDISVGENQQQNTVADVDPSIRTRLTGDSAQISSLVQNLYTLTVFNLATGQAVKNEASIPLAPTGASSIGDQFTAEFTFRVPPKVHEFSEPFATTIQATQNGGKYIETQGSIIKEVRLSGTTGLRPHRNSPSVANLFGAPVPAEVSTIANAVSDSFGVPKLDTKTGLSTLTSLGTALGTIVGTNIGLNEVIGHDDIIFLRNLFRLYSDLKSSNALAGNIIMLWRNIKDGDYWVVEPMEFRLSQSSSSPLTYEYSITLKTITPFDFQFSFEEDPIALLNDAKKLLTRTNEYVQDLTNAFLTLQVNKTKFAQQPFELDSEILSPMATVLVGLAGVRAASSRAIATLQTNVTKLRDNLVDVLDKISDQFDANDSDIRLLRRTSVTCAKILTEDKLKPNLAAVSAEKRATLADVYKKPAGASTPSKSPATGGSAAFIGNQPVPNSLGQEQVHANEDIRDIAGRVLGDRSQWHILAVVNDLEAPYVSATGGNNVLSPGDVVLYPRQGTGSENAVSALTESEAETEVKDAKEQGAIQQTYGRDLRLTSPSGGAAVVDADFRANQLGDISTIQGIPNVGQALKLKFAIERGELPSHPSFGSQFRLGSKATPQSLAAFRIQVTNTLLSDDRIKGIRTLNLSAYSDVLVLTASLILRDSNKALKTSLPIRSFT